MNKKIVDFVKHEVVLVVAFILAVISAFIITPSIRYADYIDFRVLAILLSLMLVMEGLKQLGLFENMAIRLLGKTTNLRQIILILVLLCFFSSMLITNDVALITFVPFSIMTLTVAGLENKIIKVVVLQTVAANLGSMLTPLGNPQNLYIYSLSGMTFGRFIVTMLPISVVSLGLILISIYMIKNTTIDNSILDKRISRIDRRHLIIYTLLFILCIAAVIRVIPYQLALLITVCAMLISDKKILISVDYSLLITFICFFIFIGNMGEIESVSELLSGMIGGHEIITGLLSSQIISNVPAAILLSRFTEDYVGLLYGVNIGGLGTLIASMASLISYKYYARTDNAAIGKYIKEFTLYNIIFMIVLLVLSFTIY